MSNDPFKPEPQAADIVDWRDFASCREVGGDIWHPEQGHNEHVPVAKAICADCPVKLECLEHALTHDEQLGIWGGLSERERRPLHRKAKAARRAA